MGRPRRVDVECGADDIAWPGEGAYCALGAGNKEAHIDYRRARSPDCILLVGRRRKEAEEEHNKQKSANPGGDAPITTCSAATCVSSAVPSLQPFRRGKQVPG